MVKVLKDYGEITGFTFHVAYFFRRLKISINSSCLKLVKSEQSIIQMTKVVNGNSARHLWNVIVVACSTNNKAEDIPDYKHYETFIDDRGKIERRVKCLTENQ